MDSNIFDPVGAVFKPDQNVDYTAALEKYFQDHPEEIERLKELANGIPSTSVNIPSTDACTVNNVSAAIIQKKNIKFISLEGIDGSGKTTQVNYIKELIEKSGKEVVVTREPGGTVIAESIRNILLNTTEKISSKMEIILNFAARQDHIDKIIKPAIQNGSIVLSDRYVDSTYAYQVHGRGMDINFVNMMRQHVCNDVMPDITFYFDIPVEKAMARISADRKLDRFEKEKIDFHLRVRDGYLKHYAYEVHGRVVIIDATKSIEEIQGIIQLHLIYHGLISS